MSKEKNNPGCLTTEKVQGGERAWRKAVWAWSGLGGQWPVLGIHDCSTRPLFSRESGFNAWDEISLRGSLGLRCTHSRRWAGDATWTLQSPWDGFAGQRAGTVLMFSVQSPGTVQELSRTADAGNMPRCNFVLSLVGIINCGSTTGVRTLAGGRAAVLPCCRAVLCSPDDDCGHEYPAGT